MDTKDNKFVDKISDFFKKNFKLAIYLLVAIFLLFIFFQYYYYSKNNKTLKLSLLFEDAITNIDSNDFDEKMNLISNENEFVSVLAKIELIKKSLNAKEYEYAYEQYLKILNDNNYDKIYQTIIALHGSYNLIDYISNENIINLLSFVDESLLKLIGYKKEIEYLLLVKSNNIEQGKILFSEIINSRNIQQQIKDRVIKVNELEKYK